MKSTKLSTLLLSAIATLLVSQFAFAQRAALPPDKTLVSKAIQAALTTGKPVPVVPVSTIKGLAAVRPTLWLTSGKALSAKSKPAGRPIGALVTEPYFCEGPWTYGYIFCPYGVQTAYGTKQIVGANGGAGMTIAIVDAFAYANAEADLAQFNSDMGLPACTTANGCFTSIDLSGGNDGTGSGWDMESMLDLEYAHAMAPNAKLVYVQALDNYTNNLGAAEGIAAGLADVVSNSWSAVGEDPSSDFYWALGKPLLFASGDSGSWVSQGGPGYPCSSSEPGVTCVGGTSLHVNASSQRTSEVGWAGSGGGCSLAEPIPWWQVSNGSNVCGLWHASPDIAAIADPATGVAVYINNWYYGTGYYIVGGTSLATPVTAGLVANLDTALVSFGKPKWASNLTQSLYGGAAANYGYYYSDILTGNNGNAAGPQFDLVTGLGNLTGKNAASRFFGLLPVNQQLP